MLEEREILKMVLLGKVLVMKYLSKKFCLLVIDKLVLYFWNECEVR